MEFNLFFHSHVVDPEISPAAEKMDADQIISAFGQGFHIHLGIGVQAQEIVVSQIDFSPALSGTEFVSFNDEEVDNSFFKAKISGSLDIYISLDKTEAGIAFRVIALFARSECKGKA